MRPAAILALALALAGPGPGAAQQAVVPEAASGVVVPEGPPGVVPEGALEMAASEEVQQVVADLDQSDVSINSTFSGSEILVFGALRGGGPDSEVVVTVAGPSEPVTVWRKGRIGPIWANVLAAEIDSAPSFYAVATSAPLREMLSNTSDLRHAITVPQAIRAVGTNDPATFTAALIRMRTETGAYATREGAVALKDGALFRTTIALPPDLTEGDYAVRIFLIEERRVAARFETVLAVRKVGLERILYGMAHERPALYGAMSLAIAVAAGWLASAAFGALRR